MSADVLAVVRSMGERTEAACVRRVRTQCDAVEVLSGVTPFAAAVRQCFRLAIASGATWLLTVDADVLLDRGALAALLEQSYRHRGWQIIGRVHDRLVGQDRMAGVRLYRVSVLPAVLPYVSDATPRPEGTLARLFGGWDPSTAVVGRHDYEQWFADYHRKGAQHRAKHPGWERHAQRWRTSGEPELVAAADGWYGVPLSLPEREPLTEDAA